MDLSQLRKIAANGESQQVEFKKKAAHPEKILKEVVAFANSGGGWLLIGVDDNGTLSGLKFPEEEEGTMTKAIEAYCQPPINYTTYHVPLNKKKAVLAYEIHPSDRKPHRVNFEEKALCYVRIGDRSVKASREMQEIIRRQRNPKDMKVQYGEKEMILMKHLQENDAITLTQFQKLAQIPRKQASRTLIHLVLSNILDVTPEEKGDKYFLHSSF